MNEKYFEKFTKKYALSKTLRFELVPQGETENNLRISGILSRDKEKDTAYEKVKPLFDILHETFIGESLSQVYIDFNEYKKQFDTIQKTQERDTKQKYIKELEKTEKILRQQIVKYFTNTGDIWAKRINSKDVTMNQEEGEDEQGIKKDKNIGIKILFTKPVLALLKEGNKENQENIQEIEKFDNFFTYFTGFNKNRENYYSSEEKSTAISHRIINENLPKFCSNVLSYESRKEIYTSMKQFLQEKNIILKAKDAHILEDIDETKFSIAFFNQCLSQTNIESYNEYIGDINFLINLYNQQRNGEKDFKKLPPFKTLFKQIGCGKKDTFFFALTSDEEIKHLLQKFVGVASKKNKEIIKFIEDLVQKEDFSQIYFSKKSLNTLSAKYFVGGWNTLSQLFLMTKLGKYDKASDEVKISEEYISLADIFEALEVSQESTENLFKVGRKLDSQIGEWESIFENSKKTTFLKIFLYEFQKSYKDWETTKMQLEKQLETLNYNGETDKVLIKSFCDTSLVMIQMLKYFIIKESKVTHGVDGEFYNTLNLLLDREDYDVFGWYDAIRNYLTQKPESTEKLKLNFDQSTLLGGWDINKENANLGVILQDEMGREYLAITNKKNNFSFDKIKNKQLYDVNSDTVWKKMEYKLLPGPNKMLPKVLFAKNNVQTLENPKGYFTLSQEILDIRKKESFKKGESFNPKDLIIWIDFCKENIKKYPDWSVFDFNFRKSDEYEDVSKFYTDVERQGYRLNFISINKGVLDNMVEAGEVYLFLIKNKDITNKESTKNKNIHTLYWKALFESLENKPKLNGEAEIFFRKKTDTLPTKKDKGGKEVIDKKRYAKDTFLFHVPITLNFCAKDEKINDAVNTMIVSKYDETHIIGIDRGEKHLAYYSIINTKGNIVEQGTLNIPFFDTDLNPRSVKAEKYFIEDKPKKEGEDWLPRIVECWDYNDLLDARASNRDLARKNWKTIGTIKELKEGYIGHAIHEVVQLIRKYNAVIVLEDLNTGFKRGRQKIEKSIYQKFELALAKKLNFLVEKGKTGDEIGSSTNALQLTPPVQNYQDIENKKQVGIMFYTRANYTSTTDPVTGWRKNIYLKKGGKDDIKEQIKNFKEIGYDSQKKAYYFLYNPKDFPGNKALAKDWKIWSCVDRYKGQNIHGIWEIQKVDITSMLDSIFVGCDKNRDIRTQIIEEGVELQKISEEHTGWGSLLYALSMIMQIRNTGPKDTQGNPTKDDDFIFSPVSDESGEYFDSRKYYKEDGNYQGIKKVVSGDSNGAYNIARKGLMMIDKIQKYNDVLNGKVDLFISDIDWDEFITHSKKSISSLF